MFARMGSTELIIIFSIALLIFGPKNLPKLGKAIGQTFGNFRKGQKEGLDGDEEKTAKAESSDANNDKAE